MGKLLALTVKPTSVILQVLDVLLPVITCMNNMSFESGLFAEKWQQALVWPTLKKCSMDIAYLNFRPVSNLSYASKLWGRAAPVNRQETPWYWVSTFKSEERYFMEYGCVASDLVGYLRSQRSFWYCTPRTSCWIVWGQDLAWLTRHSTDLHLTLLPYTAFCS